MTRLERLKAECARSDIRLMVFTDPKNFETYEMLVELRANYADLSEIDAFIAADIKEKDTILKWSM